MLSYYVHGNLICLISSLSQVSLFCIRYARYFFTAQNYLILLDFLLLVFLFEYQVLVSATRLIALERSLRKFCKRMTFLYAKFCLTASVLEHFVFTSRVTFSRLISLRSDLL